MYKPTETAPFQTVIPPFLHAGLQRDQTHFISTTMETSEKYTSVRFVLLKWFVESEGYTVVDMDIQSHIGLLLHFFWINQFDDTMKKDKLTAKIL